MNARIARQSIQSILGVKVDGDIGPVTIAALNRLKGTPDDAEWPPVAPHRTGVVHVVKASSFADPADVAAFIRCKATGKTDVQCFAVGDNGIGCFGDDTTKGLWVALPPEDMEERWGSVKAAKHKEVRVRANGKEVIAKVGDRMPARARIENGAGIDLSPDTVAALGLRVPLYVDAEWEWA